jgi:glycosyltransferase involved in cell wall biosynthesis
MEILDAVVKHRQMAELFGRAACVLMTSRWQEPFGLVAIETMARETPVIALARGALPGKKYARGLIRRF